jgi:hypothetical protein
MEFVPFSNVSPLSIADDLVSHARRRTEPLSRVRPAGDN